MIFVSKEPANFKLRWLFFLNLVNADHFLPEFVIFASVDIRLLPGVVELQGVFLVIQYR